MVSALWDGGLPRRRAEHTSTEKPEGASYLYKWRRLGSSSVLRKILVTSQSPDVRDCRMSVLLFGWRREEERELTGRSSHHHGATTPQRHNATATAPLLTIEVDMEMWKNFPRPP
ncbi:hypothetical protein EYF80_065041 [Liparis tanakae]|uniref:Uncharacterized protein n=1 Tax=Liparis tanakae TaxID=230148 RepID=A0A4Z2E841_9TELE|nr:hypothetical protein EYF80_065041 [Liparis tanakae]